MFPYGALDNGPGGGGAGVGGAAGAMRGIYWVSDEYTDVPDGTVMKLTPK